MLLPYLNNNLCLPNKAFQTYLKEWHIFLVIKKLVGLDSHTGLGLFVICCILMKNHHICILLVTCLDFF